MVNTVFRVCVFSLILFSGVALAKPKVAIALHGGAGTISRSVMSPAQEAEYLEILDQAVELGRSRLLEGAAGVDVVVEVIQLMEESPLFNAGKGAVLTWDGQHELDASIMDGETLQAGAVAGVTTVKSPIAAARAVMRQSEHVMLAGSGAESFAASVGLEVVSNDYFTTERRLQALDRYKSSRQAGLPVAPTSKFGTVGVVVLDVNGNLAAGTSTGGMTGKRWGRIGDAPIIGAGTYADNQSCAVSATGHGEFFIRYQVASDICARVKYQGKALETAAFEVIQDVLEPVAGEGGVVAVAPNGDVAMIFNSEGMYRASIDGNGKKTIAIYGDGAATGASSDG